jgi:aryl-alcohol dehydrogenase
MYGSSRTVETTALMPVLRQAIDVLALRGTCGFVGGAPGDSELTFVTSHVMNGGRTIRGIVLGDTNPEEFLPKLIELQRLGRFPLEKLVTFYPFKNITFLNASSTLPAATVVSGVFVSAGLVAIRPSKIP